MPTLSSADPVGILEDLLPGEDVTGDIRYPGDRWTTPPSRRIARCGAWIGFGASEPNCWMVRLPTADLRHVHDRMPALLLSRDLGTWLHGTPEQAQEAALSSWRPGVLQVQAV